MNASTPTATQPADIRACIFDMGRVLVEFCHDRMLDQMATVCHCPAAKLRELLFDSGQLEQYETGHIEEDDLFAMFERELGVQLDRSALQLAASDIFTEKTEMIPLLTELKNRSVRLVLLSNTSRNHFEFIRERISILDLFEAYVLSYEVRALKPDPRIYQAAIQAAGVPAEQTFFTDDIAINVAGAQQCGIHAAQFIDEPQLRQTLQSLGVLPAAE